MVEVQCLQCLCDPGADVWLVCCQLDCSEPFSTCHPTQLAQSWSLSIHHCDHPCFGVMTLFTVDFNQLGVKLSSDLHLIKGIFLLSFFSFAMQLVSLLWILKICNKRDLLMFHTLKIRACFSLGAISEFCFPDSVSRFCKANNHEMSALLNEDNKFSNSFITWFYQTSKRSGMNCK